MIVFLCSCSLLFVYICFFLQFFFWYKSVFFYLKKRRRRKKKRIDKISIYCCRCCFPFSIHYHGSLKSMLPGGSRGGTATCSSLSKKARQFMKKIRPSLKRAGRFPVLKRKTFILQTQEGAFQSNVKD